MKYILFVLVAVLTVMSFTAPPAKGFAEPELARIIFFHLPAAFATTIFCIVSAIAGLQYLRTKNWLWELRCHASSDLALSLGIATMLSGMLFSKAQWGAWWHWDPRQTSFLIVLFLLAGYFAVRMAFDDEQLRARAACAYATISVLPNFFFIAVFPRLPQVADKSLHPSDTVQGGKFSGEYWMVILPLFAMLLIISFWIYNMNVRAGLLARKAKDLDGMSEAGAGATTSYRVERQATEN
ncbi:MAG: cytochrome c biogenesis protein CcsA [Armatimonadetes bacterium]|nr:cytochrome c biogenesis protein CcsA [Armatimonadota bacterium]